MKRLVMLAAFFFSLYIVYAQIPESPKTVLSPNAASLGLYGEIPVSSFTGTPSISIPLYEFQLGNSSFPISLSYHASGVRPDQHPGWAGLGWSLNAGGVISRNVNDMPDESNNISYYKVEKNGFYYRHELLNRADWNQREYLKDLSQIQSDLLDTESDEYSFNFMGYHGNFYIDANGQWKVQCDKPIDVKFSGNFINIPFQAASTHSIKYGYSPSFEGFTLITEDGTQYVFGGSDTSIEYSIEFFNQHDDEWVATSWYLTKIINPNKNEINLIYEKGDFINQMYIGVYANLSLYAQSKGEMFNPDPCCESSEFPRIYSSYHGKLIAPVYLKKITLPNGSVNLWRRESSELRYDESIYNWNFSEWYRTSSSPFLPFLSQDKYSSNYLKCLDKLKWYELSLIEILDSKNSLIKRFEFNYSYNPSQRLLLNSLQETSGNNPDNTITLGRKYSFEYNQSDSLPAYLANKTDHWGFYNNTYAKLDGKYDEYYKYREPNASVLKYGILDKIIYPTGGYTHFVFEPHIYRKQLSFKRWESCNEMSENKIAGGLRIRKIINSATGNIADEKTMNEYFYVSDYLQNRDNANKSSGVLGGQSQYYFQDYQTFASNQDIKYKREIFSSQSALPGCSNSCGSHIGYTEVIEKKLDNSYRRYQFTNFDNGHMDDSCEAIVQPSRTPYEPYSSKEQERGLPFFLQDYDSNGILKKSKFIEYEKNDNSSDNYVKMMRTKDTQICTGTYICEGNTYKKYTYNYRTTKETETNYTNGTSPINLITSYLYNNNKLIKEISKTTNRGIYKTNYKRAEEYTTGIYPSMVSSHVLSPVVEVIESLDQTDGTSKILKQTRYNYTKWSNVSSDFYAPSSVESSVGSAALENRITYSKYDKRGNLVYMIENGSEATVYVWGYNYQYLVGEVKNATLTEVESVIGDLDLFASALVADFTKIDKLRSSLKNAQVTSYDYKPLYGMTLKISPHGITTYYEYDSLGRLTGIKDNLHNLVENCNYNYK